MYIVEINVCWYWRRVIDRPTDWNTRGRNWLRFDKIIILTRLKADNIYDTVVWCMCSRKCKGMKVYSTCVADSIVFWFIIIIACINVGIMFSHGPIVEICCKILAIQQCHRVYFKSANLWVERHICKKHLTTIDN